MIYRAVMAVAVVTLGAANLIAQTASTAQTNRPEGEEDAWAAACMAVGDPKKWIAGSSSVTIEMLDRNGETDRTIVLDQQVFEEGDALVLVVTPISVSSGGGGLPTPPGAPGGNQAGMAPDRNSRMGRMLAEGSEGGGTQSQVPANPFDPAIVDTVDIRATGSSRSMGGEPATEYAIAWTDEDASRYEGSLWLHAESSAPIRLQVTGELAEDDIREFETTISYEEVDDFYLPARSITRASRRMNIFVTVRTRITVTYDNYFETDGAREIVLRGPAAQEE